MALAATRITDLPNEIILQIFNLVKLPGLQKVYEAILYNGKLNPLLDSILFENVCVYHHQSNATLVKIGDFYFEQYQHSDRIVLHAQSEAALSDLHRAKKHFKTIEVHCLEVWHQLHVLGAPHNNTVLGGADETESVAPRHSPALENLFDASNLREIHIYCNCYQLHLTNTQATILHLQSCRHRVFNPIHNFTSNESENGGARPLLGGPVNDSILLFYPNTLFLSHVLLELDLALRVLDARTVAFPSLRKLVVGANEILDLRNFNDPNLLPKLEELAVVRNNFSEMPNVFQLPTLAKVDFRLNQIKKLDNVQFSQCLKHLCLANNNISDIEPLGRLTELEHLNLNANKIDCIPESFANLTRLETLSICSNNLTNIDILLKLQRLNKLALVFNKLKELPENLEAWAQCLEMLYLSKNALLTRFDSVCSLTNLKYLAIEQHKGIPLPPAESFRKLQNLETLKLKFMRAADDDDDHPMADMDSIRSLPSLRHLILCTGVKIPEVLKKIRRILPHVNVAPHPTRIEYNNRENLYADLPDF